MRTLHPDCAYADVMLAGRERFSSMNVATFDSKGGRWQRVRDLKSLAVYVRTRGFAVKQYDKDGRSLAEYGLPPPPRPTPVKIVKANIPPDLDWRELELDAAGEQLEGRKPTAHEEIASIEDQWLAEQKARGETLDGSKFVGVRKTSGTDPLLRHVFGTDWSESMKVFELQAACRRREIEFDKGDNRTALIDKLKADDSKRSDADAAQRAREGLTDEVQTT